MDTPTDRHYLETHEWHLPTDDGLVVIGISAFAVEELTDITYVEVAKQDGEIKAGESFGEIESVKATSDLYCGIDGEVVAVNETVVEDPSKINDDPYGKGWIIKVRPADAGQVQGLLTSADYDAKHGG